MSAALHGISSMATRQLLAELVANFRSVYGVVVKFESVGGVDASRRVLDGEPFDVVVLASDAIEKLVLAGRLDGGRTVGMAVSGVSVAVAKGTMIPDVSTAQAVRNAVMTAKSVGYSTGPSGVALGILFDQWGLTELLKERLIQAPAGTPVGNLIANGKVELGFQQTSELIAIPGIEIAGPLPPEIQIVTTFSVGISSTSKLACEAMRFLEYVQLPATAEIKRRHGMRTT